MVSKGWEKVGNGQKEENLDLLIITCFYRVYVLEREELFSMVTALMLKVNQFRKVFLVSSNLPKQFLS
jgi:hypothetical protein